MLFLISAIRAVVEMIGLCLIGQMVLHVLAGERRHANPIYRFFDLVTRAPRALVARCLPKGASPVSVGLCCLLLLFLMWIGLAAVRQAGLA